MLMTKEELLSEIRHCYFLNNELRRQNRACLTGSVIAMILSFLFLGVCIFGSIKLFNEGIFVPAGVMIGCCIVAIIIFCVAIFLAISCKIDLKKCDEIDNTLKEKELELRQETKQEINIMA